MKVCVSSSCRFEKDWEVLRKKFVDIDARFIYPEVQDLNGLSKDEIDQKMELTNMRYYREIEDADVLYVYCPGGYIGKGVASEIGYSIAKGKDIVSSDNIDDLGMWSLVNKVMNPVEFREYLRSEYHV